MAKVDDYIIGEHTKAISTMRRILVCKVGVPASFMVGGLSNNGYMKATEYGTVQWGVAQSDKVTLLLEMPSSEYTAIGIATDGTEIAPVEKTSTYVVFNDAKCWIVCERMMPEAEKNHG